MSLAALLLISCGTALLRPPTSDGGYAAPRPRCAVLVVSNRTAETIRIRGEAGTSAGVVEALATARLQLCGAQWIGQYPRFSVRAVGGRFALRTSDTGMPRMEPGDVLELLVQERQLWLRPSRAAGGPQNDESPPPGVGGGL